MRRRSSRLRNVLVFAATGWLFADLFIALGMGFLVANTVGQPLPTPTAQAGVPTPTATPRPALQLTPITIYVSGFNPQGLLNNDPQAISDAERLTKQAIQSNPALSGKVAGIVLTFGGSPTANDTGTALSLADQFNNIIMPMLGRQGLLFINTKYRRFFNLGQSESEAQLDIYVFQD